MPECLDWCFLGTYLRFVHLILRCALGGPSAHISVFCFYSSVWSCLLKVSEVIFAPVLACFRITQWLKPGSVLLYVVIWDLDNAGNGEPYSCNSASVWEILTSLYLLRFVKTTQKTAPAWFWGTSLSWFYTDRKMPARGKHSAGRGWLGGQQWPLCNIINVCSSTGGEEGICTLQEPSPGNPFSNPNPSGGFQAKN